MFSVPAGQSARADMEQKIRDALLIYRRVLAEKETAHYVFQK
jgi:hypothetical protein